MDPMNPELEIVPAKEYEAITHEDCLTEYVFWEDFWWSPARVWDDVRWVARRVYMNKEQLRKRFGDKIAEQVPLSKQKKNADSNQPQNDPWNKAGVFEIWDRTTKKVYWHVLGMHIVLDEKDDPLKLETFFPCPPPLIANPTTSNFMPRADYQLAQDQYDQIDELTTRITYLTRAAKVVGAYDSSSTELGRIFNEGMENQMIPVTNWAQFSREGRHQGLDGLRADRHDRQDHQRPDGAARHPDRQAVRGAGHRRHHARHEQPRRDAGRAAVEGAVRWQRGCSSSRWR